MDERRFGCSLPAGCAYDGSSSAEEKDLFRDEARKEAGDWDDCRSVPGCREVMGASLFSSEWCSE
jgi:hypothetical protein